MALRRGPGGSTGPPALTDAPRPPFHPGGGRSRWRGCGGLAGLWRFGGVVAVWRGGGGLAGWWRLAGRTCWRGGPVSGADLLTVASWPVDAANPGLRLATGVRGGFGSLIGSDPGRTVRRAVQPELTRGHAPGRPRARGCAGAGVRRGSGTASRPKPCSRHRPGDRVAGPDRLTASDVTQLAGNYCLSVDARRSRLARAPPGAPRSAPRRAHGGAAARRRGGAEARRRRGAEAGGARRRGRRAEARRRVESWRLRRHESLIQPIARSAGPGCYLTFT